MGQRNSTRKTADRDLEREIKHKGDIFLLEEQHQHENFVAAVTMLTGHQCKEKMGSSERKVNKNTYHIASIKFLEVSRCSRAKQRQRNVQKTCAACAKLLFC